MLFLNSGADITSRRVEVEYKTRYLVAENLLNMIELPENSDS